MNAKPIFATLYGVKAGEMIVLLEQTCKLPFTVSSLKFKRTSSITLSDISELKLPAISNAYGDTVAFSDISLHVKSPWASQLYSLYHTYVAKLKFAQVGASHIA